MPLSALYVQNSFDEESRQRAKEMVEYIRNQFIETLEQVDWMDDDTKSRAIEKAEQMNVQIGYPPELLDTQKVMQIYEGVSVKLIMIICHLMCTSVDHHHHHHHYS